MGLWELCVRRPVLATVLSLLIVLVGLVSYQRLTVREYPNIDEPVVSVITTYTGANSAIIESQITQPLEESIAGIADIKTIDSSSRDGRSRINVRFNLGVNPEAAASEVRDRVGRARGKLPEEIDEPIIQKVEADATAILYISVNSDRHTPLEVTDAADRLVKERLQSLPGVAEVQISGARTFAMRIWIDRARLAAYGVTVQDLEAALRGQNANIPAGRIESQAREFTVQAETDLETPAQFEQIVIKDANGYLVRVRDVARVEIGPLDDRIRARFNGRDAVTVGVIKQATANPLDVANAVNAVLPAIQQTLPQGMRIEMGYDQTVFIDRSIRNVFHTLIEAVLLVVVVIFLFLRSGRATLIPLVTIPVSLIGACAMMYVFGFSLNTLTLLSFVLAIGLVVDDAIVMLENIFRHIEEGVPPVAAAIQGAREIAFAVIAMTLTLVAVYAPVAFSTGRVGKLFTEFALTLAGAVVVSGFVALSLTPMMCSRLLHHQDNHGFFYRGIENLLEGLRRLYLRAASASLRVWPVVVVLALAVAGANYVLYGQLKSELAPIEDRSVVLSIGVAPEGATIDYSSRYAEQMERLISQIPEALTYVMLVGQPEVTNIISFGRLKAWEDRDRTQQEIVADFAPKLASVAGVLAYPNSPPSLGQNFRSKPIQYVIQISGSYDQLDKAAQAVIAEARRNPGLVNLESDLNLNKPQLRVELARDKIADVGVSVDVVGRTLETLLGGRQVTRFERNGKQYDVMVKLDDADRRAPSDLTDIYVRGRSGEMIQLSNLVSLVETVAPRELNRFNQARSATISATLAPGMTLGQALTYLDEVAARVLPPGARVDYAGQSREFRESSASLYVTFILALGFIFLVLSAQFESFFDPLIILFTVPLSLAGALLALWLNGITLNIYSQIGLITLIGLITKHGILIVDFSNRLQEQGRSKREAVLEAAALRLRPILMTTAAMVLGCLPLALAKGAGAESRQSIGWVIVGGMTIGTVLTLFVVPTAYLLLGRSRAPAATPIEDDGITPLSLGEQPAE